jgi:hypothetical protein
VTGSHSSVSTCPGRSLLQGNERSRPVRRIVLLESDSYIMSAECCGSFTTAAVSSKTEGRTRLSAMLGLTVGSNLPEESSDGAGRLFGMPCGQVRSQVRSGQVRVLTRPKSRTMRAMRK